MIPQATVQQVKDTAKIFDVVARFVDLKKAGVRYRGLCPFHTEKTGSFYVTPSLNICKCYGCGAGGDAVWFVGKHLGKTFPEAVEYVGGLYNISIDSTGSRPKNDFTPPPRPARPSEPPPSFFPKSEMLASLKQYERNHFAQFLKQRFGADIASDLIGRYFVGTSRAFTGANIFWQIDLQGRVRSGKIMVYHLATGKRDREKLPNGKDKTTWAHIAAKKQGFVLGQCFFGEHLLSKRPTAPVAIVESEKTAILASAYLPDFVWLASGGKGGLGPDKFAALKGRLVTLWPDASLPDANEETAFQLWSDKAAELQKAGYSISVSNLIERLATDDERTNGYDLADYLLRFDPASFQEAHNAPQSPTAHEPLPSPTTSALRDEQGYPAAWDEPLPPAPSRLQEAAKLMAAHGWEAGKVEPITDESEKEWAAKRERARRWYPQAYGIERAAPPPHVTRMREGKRQSA